MLPFEVLVSLFCVGVHPVRGLQAIPAGEPGRLPGIPPVLTNTVLKGCARDLISRVTVTRCQA